MGSGSLKPGWTQVAFGEVVQLSKERSADPESAGLKRYVGLEHLDPGDITRRALRECSLTIIPAESTLVAMIGQGATRGRAALLRIDATINQNLAAVTPGADMHPRFLFYQLDAQYRALRYWSQGSNQHALNCQLIADFPIWVPAMATQVTIARQLDRCSDASRASSVRAAEVRTLQKDTIESFLG